MRVLESRDSAPSIWKAMEMLFYFIAISITMELGIRLFRPNYCLRYSTANFSARYHHITPRLKNLLNELTVNKELYKKRKSIVFIGDSFVEGMGMKEDKRFITIIQNTLNEIPDNKIHIINLGLGSFSPILYERIYRDIVLMLEPEIVIICLDQTDMIDDYLYEKELSLNEFHSCFEMSFQDTLLEKLKKHKISYWLLKNSRWYLALNNISTRIFHISLMPKDIIFAERNKKKIDLYIETCKNPQTHSELFDISEKYITSIIKMKPEYQRLIFVTYPRAEHIADQPKSIIINGAIKDTEGSMPYFEYWIKSKNLSNKYPHIEFYHSSNRFRKESQNGKILYFHMGDVHWNEEGHRLFATIILNNLLHYPLQFIN